MKYGIFELYVTYGDNGIFGDGYECWPKGTAISCVQTVGSLEAARETCEQLAEKNPHNTYFFAEVYGRQPGT